jgi:hypothetical protein
MAKATAASTRAAKSGEWSLARQTAWEGTYSTCEERERETKKYRKKPVLGKGKARETGEE